MLLKISRNLCSLSSRMSRIFAISDIHVDIPENLHLVQSWSASDYQQDVLIVAGDVTDNMTLLKSVLQSLTEKFSKVCFVPENRLTAENSNHAGNHDLWIRKTSDAYGQENSISKFHALVALCDAIGVYVRPVKVQCRNNTSAWVVPIYSWYAQPEDDPNNSLYIARDTEDAEFSKRVWMDNHMCKWPSLQRTVSQHFAELSEKFVNRNYDAPVISFSHFLPRLELIPASDEEMKHVEEERKRLNLPVLDNPKAQGAQVQFNFTRFAGSKTIDEQIRRLGSKVHVHGHQHRNRDRVIDGVRYVSFCLGYPRERSIGVIWGLSEGNGPTKIWPME